MLFIPHFTKFSITKKFEKQKPKKNENENKRRKIKNKRDETTHL